MKKAMAAGMAAALCLFMFGCGQQNNSGSNSQQTGASAQSTPASSAQSSSDILPNYSEPPAKPPVEVVYHEDDDIQLWVCHPDGEADGITQVLYSIDEMYYGSAGSTLHQAAVAVDLICLTQQPDTITRLDEYLAVMTDLQRDYFSFQWQMMSKAARELLKDPEAAKPMLESVSLEDFVFSNYTMEELDKLDEQVRARLAGYGVADSWKNHTDLEPFFAAGE